MIKIAFKKKIAHIQMRKENRPSVCKIHFVLRFVYDCVSVLLFVLNQLRALTAINNSWRSLSCVFLSITGA